MTDLEHDNSEVMVLNLRWTARNLKGDAERIVDAFRRLPAEERVRLVEELWDELARELEERPLSEAQKRLLDERIRQHEEDPGDVESWETARDDLLREL